MTGKKIIGHWIMFALMLFIGQGVAYAEPDYNALADAIKKVEGVPYYGIKGVPWKDYAEARRICVNTCRNNYKRWIKAGKHGSYLDFLADRYCPPSVDLVGNRNWKRNIKKLYKGAL